MWQVLASCERLTPDNKAELGEELLRAVEKGKASDQEVWAFSRIGARTLIHGPANCVVRREVATRWVEHLLREEWRNPETLGFAVVQLARCTGDRSRDLEDEVRQKVADRLRPLSSGERWAKQVLEVVTLETREQAQILDESLPVGLRIKNEES
jgi:hypothetical protein